MLSKERKYLWQFINAADGRRSEPFIGLIQDVREASVDMCDAEKDGVYLLLLADINVEMKPQDFVSRFPIYRLSTFLSLDPENYARPIPVEEETTNG